MKYQEYANVKINFVSSQAPGEVMGAITHTLYGFLAEDGLTIQLRNEFENSLNIAGGFLGMLQEGIAGWNALGGIAAQGLPTAKEWGQVAADFYETQKSNLGKIGGYLTKVGNKVLQKAGEKWATTTTGYISAGLGGKDAIILNTPYYWKAIHPISFNLSVHEIADESKQILTSYQRVLESLSASLGSVGDMAGENGQSLRTIANAVGPSTVYVHYFPTTDDGSPNKDAQGRVIFGPCLCETVSMDIKQPFGHDHDPILGTYTFALKTARIVDRMLLNQIFRGADGLPLNPPPDPIPITWL